MTTPSRALVIIDVQREYIDGPLTIQYPPRDKSLAQILYATEAAERAGIPIVVVQHAMEPGAPVFAVGSNGWQLQEALADRVTDAWKPLSKNHSSVFAGTDLEAWLRERGIDTVTLVGYMTNNCVLASAAAAEPLGFAVEVISDATGAINLTNEAGSVPARQLHDTLMVLLHSNFAAVSDLAGWTAAVAAGSALPKSNLVISATAAG
jgi:nicotinamidase-related amidase